MIADPDERAQTIAGLHALADFLHDHPEVPISPHGITVRFYPRTGTDHGNTAEVDRIADALGVTPTGNQARVYTARRCFGPVHFEATAISTDFTNEIEARQSYEPVITL